MSSVGYFLGCSSVPMFFGTFAGCSCFVSEGLFDFFW